MLMSRTYKTLITDRGPPTFGDGIFHKQAISSVAHIISRAANASIDQGIEAFEDIKKKINDGLGDFLHDAHDRVSERLSELKKEALFAECRIGTVGNLPVRVRVFNHSGLGAFQLHGGVRRSIICYRFV